MKKVLSFILALSLIISLAGCQENPEGSIVVHKDMDNLISKAQASDVSKLEAADVIDEVTENFDAYQTHIEDESLGVTVDVNAKVELPETDKLNVYRVKKKRTEQEFVDKVRDKLIGDKDLYFERALYIRTKADIEPSIKNWREMLREAEEKLANPTIEDRTEGSPDDPTIISEEEFKRHYQVVVESRQKTIDALQEKYENAPDEVDFKQYPADGKFMTNREYYERYPEFGDEYTIPFAPPDAEILDVVADGSDGLYQTLSAGNNENGGGLRYYSCPGQYAIHVALGANVDDLIIDGSATMDGGGFNKTVPENFLGFAQMFDENTVFAPLEENETTITMEEAVAKAEEFLDEIGLSGFALGEGGLYNEPIQTTKLNPWPDNTKYYRNYYILVFYREIDGALLTQSTGTKREESRDEVGFMPKIWSAEMILLRVNDAGIAGFEYDSPIEVTETIVENAVLKPFSEIKEIFEKMVCVKNASEYQITWVDVDRVRLSYSRISEKDNYDSGLIVPVWSFEGKTKYTNQSRPDLIQGGHYTETILAINAIDGSIIDGELGY